MFVNMYTLICLKYVFCKMRVLCAGFRQQQFLKPV